MTEATKRLTHLQPAQYESWLRKAHDPDWLDDDYPRPGDRAMVSAILDLEQARKDVATLADALRGVLPYTEAAEKAGLIGNEGCHWSVEIVRDALSHVGGK